MKGILKIIVRVVALGGIAALFVPFLIVDLPIGGEVEFTGIAIAKTVAERISAPKGEGEGLLAKVKEKFKTPDWSRVSEVLKDYIPSGGKSSGGGVKGLKLKFFISQVLLSPVFLFIALFFLLLTVLFASRAFLLLAALFSIYSIFIIRMTNQYMQQEQGSGALTRIFTRVVGTINFESGQAFYIIGACAVVGFVVRIAAGGKK